MVFLCDFLRVEVVFPIVVARPRALDIIDFVAGLLGRGLVVESRLLLFVLMLGDYASPCDVEPSLSFGQSLSVILALLDAGVPLVTVVRAVVASVAVLRAQFAFPQRFRSIAAVVVAHAFAGHEVVLLSLLSNRQLLRGFVHHKDMIAHARVVGLLSVDRVHGARWEIPLTFVDACRLNQLILDDVSALIFGGSRHPPKRIFLLEPLEIRVRQCLLGRQPLAMIHLQHLFEEIEALGVEFPQVTLINGLESVDVGELGPHKPWVF